jgi:hypothetical protein
MIINPVQYAEKEYQQPFADIVKGFAADGEPAHRVAVILHVEHAALLNFARNNGIRFPAAVAVTNLEHDQATRRKISRAIRAQSPRYCFRGLELSPIEWAERTGIPADTIRKRIARNWPVEKALTTPALNPQQVARLGVQARRTK